MDKKCDFFESKYLDADATIDNYLANKLSQHDADEFELHILACDECYQKLYIREQTIGVVREKGSLLFVDFIQEKRQKSEFKILEAAGSVLSRLKQDGRLRWVYAAGITVAAIIAVVFLNKDQQRAVLGENFESHPYFEEQIATQNSKRDTGDITLLSPKSGSEFNPSDDILFTWERRKDTPVILEIMNNKADKLNSITPNQNEYLFDDDLAPGLYYWKIKTKDDFRIAKFYVDQPD